MVSGCTPLGYVLYVFMPWTGKTDVSAEYDGLKNKSVAIVVYADENAQYVYPMVQRDVSARVQKELMDNIDGIEVLSPMKVVTYQRSNLRWDDMDKTEIGKDLGVDYVLYIALVEFATVEEGYQDVLRARITAEVGLYQTNLPERESNVWKGEPIRVSFPKTPAARTGNNEHLFRLRVLQMFADELAKKFYDHKEAPKDEFH